MDYQEFDKAVEYLRRYRNEATLKRKAYSSVVTPGAGIHGFEEEFRAAGEEIETLNKLLLKLTTEMYPPPRSKARTVGRVLLKLLSFTLLVYLGVFPLDGLLRLGMDITRISCGLPDAALLGISAVIALIVEATAHTPHIRKRCSKETKHGKGVLNETT